MKNLVRLLYHILPVLPISMGYHFLAAAAILLVCLSYIKVFKLETLMRETKAAEQREELRRTRDFWLGLTFIKRPREI